MRRLRGWAVLGLAGGLLAGTVLGAAETPKERTGPLERKELDAVIYSTLRNVINRGADLYNNDDWAGCYRLYEGALMMVRPLLDHHRNLQRAIDEARVNAENDPQLLRRAFVLRAVMDKIRTETNPHPPTRKPSEEKKPAVAQKPPEEKKPPVFQEPPLDKKPAAAPEPPLEKKPDVSPEPPREKKPAAAKQPPPDSGPPIIPPPAAKGTSLWERLGGEKKVRAIIHDVVATASADPNVNFDRGGKYKLDAAGAQRLENEFVEQVSVLTGGPLRYEGFDMKDAHKGMGITDAEFDAFLKHVRTALEKHKVDTEDCKAVLGAY